MSDPFSHTHLWKLILFFCLTHTGKAFAYYLFTPSKRFFSCLQFAGVYVSATVEHISCHHGARYLKIGNKFILMPVLLSVFIQFTNYLPLKFIIGDFHHSETTYLKYMKTSSCVNYSRLKIGMRGQDFHVASFIQ